MKLLGLQDVKADTPVYEISGGQKQRLAFVRAISPEFTVFFGDEPTGNLDEINSVELMKIIRSELRQRHFSAILVTHSISLATTFADMIIILTKQGETGEVLPENILHRKNDADKIYWENQTGDTYSDIWNLLLNKLS